MTTTVAPVEERQQFARPGGKQQIDRLHGRKAETPVVGEDVGRLGAEIAARDPGRHQQHGRIRPARNRDRVVVPHRRSPWSFSERTPFGQGRPYSVRQATRLLTDALFEPLGWRGALYGPPAGVNLVRWAERPGAALWPTMAGVLLVEAVKVVEARINGAKGRRVLAYART